MKQRRDTDLDAVRGFAIFLVMLGHCIVLNNMADGIVYDAIKAVQMPLFMMISGWLVGRRPLFVTAEEFGRQFGKRAVSCLVPFVSWIFITNVTDFPGKLLRVLYQPDTGLWFLLTLFLLSTFLLFALFVRDGLKLGWPGFGIALFLEAGLLCLHYLSGNTFLGPALTVNYFPFYIGGFLLGCFGERIWKRMGTRPMRGGSILCVMGLAAFLFLVLRYDMVYAHSRPEWLLQLLTSALGSSVCFFMIYNCPDGRLKQFLAWTGKYTLEIYVLHFRFATILGLKDKGLSLYSLQGVCGVTASFLLMSVLTAFCIYMFKRLAITDLLLFGKTTRIHRHYRPIE